jgi:hypothetical protein
MFEKFWERKTALKIVKLGDIRRRSSVRFVNASWLRLRLCGEPCRSNDILGRYDDGKKCGKVPPSRGFDK